MRPRRPGNMRIIADQLRPRCGQCCRARAVNALLTMACFARGKPPVVAPYLPRFRPAQVKLPCDRASVREDSMAQLAILTPDTAAAPALETAAIDRGHLARMTFGDRALERELLELFDKQAAILLVRMRTGGSAAIFALAHTLKGSANSIGACGVALAA